MLKCLIFLSISLAHSGENESTRINDDRFLHLEQTVSDLQAQTQAQEQKQAAVLSSILSELSSTTSKLQALEKEHNSTLLELTELQNRNNCTALPSSGTLRWWHQEIGFQIVLSAVTLNMSQGEILKFDTVQYNAGDGYNSTSGIFVAPTPGSYLFWGYMFNYERKPLYIVLHHSNSTIATGFTSVYAGIASMTHLVHLDIGDSVWFSTMYSTQLHGPSYSSYGGTLLHAN